MSVNDKIVIWLIFIGMLISFLALLAIFLERYKKSRTEEKPDLEDWNEKILQMHDYGDFLNKELSEKQKEAMFLYEMLLEKEKKLNTQLKSEDRPLKKVEPMEQKPLAKMTNHNQEIQQLHAQGLTEEEIARQLKIGKGQVELVLRLFNKEKS